MIDGSTLRNLRLQRGWTQSQLSELTGIPSEGLRIGVVAVRPGRGVLGAIPTLDAQGTWPLATFRLWTWTTWEEPTWHEYLKPSYRALQQLWGAP